MDDKDADPEFRSHDFFHSMPVFETDEERTFFLAALAQNIGVSQRTVSRVLKKLRDEKVIRRDSGDRRGIWMIPSDLERV